MDDPPPLQHARVLTPHLARLLQPGLELGDLGNFDAEVLEKIRYAADGDSPRAS